MSLVFRVLFLFLLVYLLDHFTGIDNSIITLLYLFTWIYAGYLVVKNYGREKKPVERPNLNTPAGKTMAQDKEPEAKRSYAGLIVIVLLVIGLVFIRMVGVLSVNFIVFMSRLLNVTSDTSAVVLWAITGLLAGIVCGSLVAWKKYRLHFTVALVPFAVLVLFVLFMFIMNDPLRPIIPPVIVSEKASRFVSVHSSGYLPESKFGNFDDSNLTDDNAGTAWIENATNSGVGEWIAFHFDTNVQMNSYRSFRCTGFHIRNGYAKTRKVWTSYNRMREFKLSLNGNDIGYFVARNEFEEEVISLKPFSLKLNDVLTIHINSVYYGNRYNKLTAISELVPIVEYTE